MADPLLKPDMDRRSWAGLDGCHCGEQGAGESELGPAVGLTLLLN